MSMVVRTNMLAMNSNRALGVNNSTVSKSMEKLSSGFRINRAADDASGLAISEKMKSQIVGLEQASANSQDGISLIQTAEGATTEIHNMLNRMKELAIKSANGTIQDEVDREAIQSEINALNDEITRIAKSTNFNGINLLDGSLSDSTTFEATVEMVNTTPGSPSEEAVWDMTVSGVELEDLTAGEHEISLAGQRFKYTLTQDEIDTATDANNLLAEKIAEAVDGKIEDGVGGFYKAEVGPVTSSVTTGGGGTTPAGGATITFTASDVGVPDTDVFTEGTHSLTVSAPRAPQSTGSVGGDDSDDGSDDPLTQLVYLEATGKIAGGTITGSDVTASDGVKQTYTIDLKDWAESSAVSLSGVATADVEYTHAGSSSDLDTEGAALATAITTAEGSLYEATYSDSDDTLTLTAKEVGAVAAEDKPEITGGGASSGDATVADGTPGEDAVTAHKTYDLDGAWASPDSITIDGKTYTYADTPDDSGLQFSDNATLKTALAANGVTMGGTADKTTFTKEEAVDPTALMKGMAVNGGMLVANTDISAKAAIENDPEGSGSAKDTWTWTLSGVEYTDVAAGDYKVNIGGTEIEFEITDADITTWGEGADDTAKNTAANNGVAGKIAAAGTGKITDGVSGGEGKYTMTASGAAITIEASGNGEKPSGFTIEAGADTDVTITAVTTTPPETDDPSGSTGGVETFSPSGITDDYNTAIGAEAFEIGGKWFKFVTPETTTAAGDNKDDPIKIILNSGDDKAAIEAKLKTALETEFGVGSVTSNPDGTWSIDTAFVAEEPDDIGLTLQIGDTADDFNQLTIEIDNLSAFGIGTDIVNLSNQEKAADAVDIIENAINKVSTNRANLGALQNRLEYTISNLDTTAENMSAANSRIRDTDMASEMMDYTKANILTQAAQAMLAQANQAPQAILQLLQ